MTSIGSSTFAALVIRVMSFLRFVYVHHITTRMTSCQSRSTIRCRSPRVHSIQKPLLWTEANNQPSCLRPAPAPVQHHCRFSHYDRLLVLTEAWSGLYMPRLYMPQSLVYTRYLFSLHRRIAGSPLPHSALRRSHLLHHRFLNSRYPSIRMQALCISNVAFSPSLDNDAKSSSTSDQTSRLLPNMVDTLRQYMDCGLAAGQIRTKAATSGYAPGKGVHA
jgi:hypothetical protein